MLQQTQVTTVIPYYQKWLSIFPSLRSLAQAPLSKALRLWAGLGYYRRVRMLHEGARYIQKTLRGRFPKTSQALMKLPGVGRYTAGAIASIAFDEKVPVLDGNVIRIFTRIFGISQSINRPATLEKLWKIAACLLPDKKSGDFNQSLMELGATVCLPLTPQCAHCPAKILCKAHAKGQECYYPVRSKKETLEKVKMFALVLKNQKNTVWIERQSQQSRWGGLWMFPFWDSKKKMQRAFKNFRINPAPCLTVQHAFTKYRIQLEVYSLDLADRSPINRKSGMWVPLTQLKNTALPSPHRKIADFLIAESSAENPFPQKGSLRSR